MPSPNPAICYFTPSAETLAHTVARMVNGEVIYLTDVAAEFRALFAAGRPIIGLCASGILIRALAPMLTDKWSEPPVLSLAEDGSSVVPLLGGHHGANALALKLAENLDCTAALTTAGDVALGVALDSPDDGWRLENPADAKAATAALLAGKPAELSGDAPFLSNLKSRVTAVATTENAPVVLTVADCTPLIYRKQTLALGLGCARNTDPQELLGLVYKTLTEAGRSPFEVKGVFSIDLKADEAAIHAVGNALSVPVSFFDAATLELQAQRLATPSDVVFAETGCHGVSEGAALTAAGVGGTLTITKHKTANATCAAATIGTETYGQKRGRLNVVGIGPGHSDWRSPEASKLIAEADELVGYGLYIDLLGPLGAHKPRTDFPLGGEEDRCRYALEQAGKGHTVALICSGDAGIYAMGALVMELMDREASVGGVSDAAKQVEVVNAPGISALQAASARAGALLGHDFCTISLSDLLTPRPQIIQRLHAAAEGDFVIAFYNPVSMRRRTLLDEAKAILLKHRPADTPVLLASNLGRPTEKLTKRTLATLETDEVDMLTVVLIGSSQSKAFQTGDLSAGAEGWRMYTPRGYAKKMNKGDAQ